MIELRKILESDTYSKWKIFDCLIKTYGIGYKRANYICNKAGIIKTTLVKDLSQNNLDIIYSLVDDPFFLINKELRRKISSDIKFYLDIKSYKGYRHFRKLPVRGQRTRTNRSTQRKFNRIRS